MKKKLDGNFTRMLRAILNKSWRQHHTKQPLYGHLQPIMKTIKVGWTRHARHCRRSKDELISNVLLWTFSHGQAKAGWPARTYIQQLCADMGCSPEDLPEAMDDREEWQERVRDICADATTWWWWWWVWKTLIKCAKHISSSHTRFYKKLSDIKPTVIHNGLQTSIDGNLNNNLNKNNVKLSWLGLLDTSTASLQRGKTSPQWVSWI